MTTTTMTMTINVRLYYGFLGFGSDKKKEIPFFSIITLIALIHFGCNEENRNKELKERNKTKKNFDKFTEIAA